MEKDQILSFIQHQLQSGKITTDDLSHITNNLAVGSASPSAVPTKDHTSGNLISVFYIIGAVIIIIGVSILVGQNWDEIGMMGRILVTLGISFVLYVAALIKSKSEHDILSQVLFMISAVLAPFGVFVVLYEANFEITFDVQAIAAAMLLIVYAVAYYISRKNILVIIMAAFGTWAYYAMLIHLFGEMDYAIDWIKWATMLLGFTYLFIAYGFARITSGTSSDQYQKRSVAGLLYGAGTIAVLGAGISIGGIWDLIFILFIFAAFYGSVFVKSRAMLIVAAFFLTAHSIKLTSEYFLDSIGWPVALILCGFLVIGVGYMTFYFNKKYLSQK